MNANGYPFTTRRQILERLNAEPEFVRECIAILQERFEQRGGGVTHMGWMVSHVARATKIASAMASGSATDAENIEAVGLARRYSKQLALVFRDRELASHPELGTQAAVFGVGHAPTNEPPDPEATGHELPAMKKRGRPKGSKNRKKR